MKPRSPIPRLSKKKLAASNGKPIYSTIASPRKAVRKSKRKPSKFARIYGSKARVEWVKSLPCAACGVVGFSENAHVAPASEKGTGYKAGYEWIVPFCGPHPSVYVPGIVIGCHEYFDTRRPRFDATFPKFNPTKAAREVQIAWLSISGEGK